MEGVIIYDGKRSRMDDLVLDQMERAYVVKTGHGNVVFGPGGEVLVSTQNNLLEVGLGTRPT